MNFFSVSAARGEEEEEEENVHTSLRGGTDLASTIYRSREGESKGIRVARQRSFLELSLGLSDVRSCACVLRESLYLCVCVVIWLSRA